jgi:hypothetical protein
VKLSARGLRDLDRGKEKITDPAELARVRRQARKVHLQSFLTAALVTALLLAIPR